METCSCGATRNTNYVAATGHNYTKTKVVEPTCTAQGYTLNTCTKCGATTRTDYVKALGHDYQKAGTITISLVCTRCGATYGSGGSGGIGGGGVGPTITPTTRPGSMYDGDEGGNETLPPVVDEEVPDETIPPVEEPVSDEEPAPEESGEPIAQSSEKILESETTSSYSYIYASGKLLQEKVTTNGTTETHNFFYDNTGKPYAMQVNGTTYYYVTNLQGDVMGLVDTSGNSVASYTYDPYGKVLTATGELADKNPLRYRGYYYDSESGLYYLQSRYYDPATRRFVNADAYASTGQGIIGTNMFAYCLNNPVMYIDSRGRDSEIVTWWTSTMWWLCGADSMLPIGDAIYVGGILVLGAIALMCNNSTPKETTEQARASYEPPSPDNDDDDYYYEDDDNYGGRSKIGKQKNKAPGNNQVQNKQFDDATKGCTKAEQRILHDKITGQGLGYHEIVELAKELFLFVMVLLVSDRD